MSELDRIFGELSEIRTQIESLPHDAAEERTRLESRRAELHAQAAAIGEARGDERPTAEVEAELAALEDRLARLEASEIDVVTQTAGSTLEASATPDVPTLNRQIEEGQGADDVRARIRRLQQELSKRAAGSA